MLYSQKRTKNKKIVKGGIGMKLHNRYEDGFIDKIIQPDIEGREYRYKKIDRRVQNLVQFLLENLNLIENISTTNCGVKFIISSKLCDEINTEFKVRGPKSKKYLDPTKLNRELRKFGEPTYNKKTGEIKENNLDFFRKVIYYRSTKSVDGVATGIYLFNLVCTPKFYDYLIDSGIAKDFNLKIPKNYKTECDRIYNKLKSQERKTFEEIKTEIAIECSADKVTTHDSIGGKVKSTTKYKVNNRKVVEK